MVAEEVILARDLGMVCRHSVAVAIAQAVVGAARAEAHVDVSSQVLEGQEDEAHG